MFDFDCGYINKPYCSLRPFDNCSPCPKFSCPPRCCPPFNPSCFPQPINPGCQFPHFPHCCTPCDGCHPNFWPQPCPPPFIPPPSPPKQSCTPFLNNFLWFYGGYRCGNRKSSPCNRNSHFLKDFINNKIN